MGKSKPTTDHLGNNFKSIKEMYLFHGFTEREWGTAREKGKSIKTMIEEREHVKIIGPDGKVYNNCKELRKKYNISAETFRRREKAGWSIEEICGITERIIVNNGGSHEIKCHNNIIHSSKKAMCEYYGISQSKYYENLKNGLTIEESLRDRALHNKCVNPITNEEYDSYNECARKNNLNINSISYYIRKGMSFTDVFMKLINESINNNRIDYDEEFFGISYRNIINKYEVELKNVRGYISKTYGTIENYILSSLLWRDKQYCGISKDGNVILKNGKNDFKILPFKEYIESLNLKEEK